MKRKLGIILCFVCLLFGIRNTYAVSSLKLDLSASNYTVSNGDEFFIYINLDSKEKISFEKIEFVLDYDTNVFEKITKTNLAVYNTYNNLKYNEVLRKATISNDVIDKNDVFQIKFKVKNVGYNKTSNIKIKDFKMFDNKYNSYNLNDKSIEIKLQNNRGYVVSNTSVSSNTNTDNIIDLKEIGNNIQTEYVDDLTTNLVNFNFDSRGILDRIFGLVSVFVYSVAVVIGFRIVVTVICKGALIGNEVRKSKKIARNLNRIFDDIGR